MQQISIHHCPTTRGAGWYGAVLAGMLVLAAAELYTPLGFAHGTLYTPLILLAALPGNRHFLLGCGATAAALTLIGIPLSPAPASAEETLAIYLGNRLFSIISIIITTSISLAALRLLERNRQVHEQLEQSLTDLQQQQYLLNVAGQVADIGGWVVHLSDDGSTRLRWSDEVCRIHGLPKGQQVQLEDAFAFYSEASLHLLRPAFRDCIAYGRSYDLELDLIDNNGQQRWVRALAQAVIRDGRTVAIHGALQDISRERNRELNLQESRLHFRQLADAIPIDIWTADTAGRPEFINRALKLHMGDRISRDAPLNRWLAHVHHDDRREALRLWAEAIRTGEPFEKELRLRHHDGSYRWHMTRAMPARDPSGTITGWFGLAMDIDQRKSMEEQLRRSEERFRYLARATADAVWDWDPARRALWWSDGMSRLFGYAPDEIGDSERFWLEHIHPEDREQVHQSLLSAIHGKASEWHRQYRFLRRDGTAAQVADHGFIIRDDKGHVIRMVGGMSDITVEKNLQEQLQQSERLRAVGELSGGVAHDFNNLLTVIMGNTELLHEELADQPRLRALTDVTRQAAERGTELTRRMLAIARRQPLHPENTDLKQLLERMRPLLRHTLRANIELELIQADDLWHTNVDPSQLENSLINLCLNARDAMPEGGQLTIETTNRSLSGGEYVMIAVRDTGTGMEENTLRHVFEPFFTTKAHGQGTGLGLSMTYGFIKQSGGHMTLESAPDQGTTVRICLPRARGEQPIRSPSPPILKECGQETILLVEDDDQVRKTVRHQLDVLGYRVLDAADADSALSLFRRHRNRIDLLFTDVILPGEINGRQLARLIRDMRAGLPVLFTSGYTRDAFEHGNLEPGTVLLSKPYQRDDLASRLRQVLDSAKAG